ncbi:DUF721 domain-containing protein [Pectobacterium polaris]|uniref:DUF721 domain-containing protein n=1 Tax=Pectobacterium polaris TaxID=2042057 RepID=A0AAP9BJZ5_9GAMM|nr:DUF721 domain-containing protein [Pectobacterium polaris]ASY80850.1 hypothetical protein BJK05_12960 [Pectobacterium polaris]MBN3214952.1 DUF721 domain-containing protein [Pectobacterium polaris]MBW5893716.1 DUF721 domain-containing protein [Pectobacterium polaris]MCA6941074.1 DUF721 domain-containing protein [Pectobacterium polaris]MCA6955342.1 DUF721 domain-containing protein [Pectobacterium polaris]
MRDSRPQSLEFLFDSASMSGKGPLQDVQQRAIALLKLNRAVRGLLPAPLHPWCRVANYRQGLLILETANASWLMRLRYEQPALLSALRAQILPSLASIDIRINPTLAAKGHEIVKNSDIAATENTHDKPLRQLSEQSAETLRTLAGNSPEKLRKILERLASLAGESTSKTSRNKK